MHGICATVLDGLQNGFGIDVALGCGLPTKGIGLISQAHVKCIAIEFGVDRHSGDPHLTGGTDNADGNFAAVGNQDFLQHR